MKTKPQIKSLLIILCLGLFFATLLPSITQAATELNYSLLESFPGFFNKGSTLTDLPTLILAIYKFGIWTVGIAGFFMLVVGGVMYMTSAGNTSAAGSAKKIIWDALLGIVAALGAYLIFYVINPDLTKINIAFTKAEVTETLGVGDAGTSGIGSGGGINCNAPTSGPCTVANLSGTCFGSNALAAAKVCGYESGGSFDSASKSDKGAEGKIFSFGLFQINLTQHSLGGLDCQAAFSGKNFASRVINPSLYEQCKTAAFTPATNINYACKISSNGKNWNPWKNTKIKCGL